MAENFNKDTLSNTYNDDFNVDKHFHQILFNNGRALQARELTQLQTLIYAEMSRLGRNVFKEGAVLSRGGMDCDDGYEYVKIAATNAGGDFGDIPVNTIFRDPTTGLEAKVLEVQPLSTDGFTLDTLYVQYINSNSATITSSRATFGDGVTLADQSGGGYQLVTHTPDASGRGVRFSVDTGDFFILGRMVNTTAQSIILNPYGQTYTGAVGYKVTQDVVTVNDDDTLYDNSGSTPNRASPGADRYRITLTLVKEEDLTDQDTFVFLARVENSVIVNKVEEIDAYNQIEELLATRTKEESGNYIVESFTAQYEDIEGNDSNLDLVVDKGIAYVNGYRAVNPSAFRMRVPTPRETELVNNDVVPVLYGNYFLIDEAQGLPDLSHGELNLSTSTTNPATGVVGTCRVRAIEKDGPDYRAYVYDVQLNAGIDVATVQTIGDANGRLDVKQANVQLFDVENNDLLMPTSRPRAESMSDIVLNVQRYVSDTSNGSSEITMPSLGAGESFVDASLWVVAEASGNFASATLNGSTLTVPSPATVYEIYYYVQKTGSVKQKTTATSTATIALTTEVTAGGNINYYDLGVPDVYQLDSARSDNSSGIDMLSRVILDDGQRDNYYADSRVILPAEDDAPANIYVKYKHFTRGVSGDFYTTSSYTNTINFKDIPSHVLSNGEEIQLHNYIDFRPDYNDGSSIDVLPLPRNGSNVTADINYFLPRADKILISENGDVQLLMGSQAGEPQFKQTPENTLALFKVTMNANTKTFEDLSIEPMKYKGYTMEDISGLESKLDALEDFTKRRFAEIENKIAPLFDSAGDVRPSSGVQIDNNNDHTQTDTENPDHRSSLDPESNLIRPMVDENNIRLIVDNALSSNVTKNGDTVSLAYTQEQWRYQSNASSPVNINPFGHVDNVGTLKLSPSSDEFKESVEEARRVVQGQNRLSARQALLWNNWSWNWQGRRAEDQDLWNPSDNYSDRRRAMLEAREQRASTRSRYATATSSGQHVDRVVSSETIRSIVNGRVVDLALIPWMRSRKVFFHAKGLTPNTKFTPFFDGTDVSAWCREESTFVQWSDRTDDIGNQFRSSNVTAHPSGSGDLISDANGEIIGSFFIPNIKPRYYQTVRGRRRLINQNYIRFRSGVREFKLLDIDRNDWSDAGSKAFAYYSAIGQVDKAWAGFWSLRGWKWVAPWSAIWRSTAFNPNELRTVLNNVSAGNVNIFEPQAAGRYGPNTSFLNTAALQGLDATGQMSQVLSDYIDVNTNVFAGTNANPLSLPQNPLAQTFIVDNQFGVTLTKVSLYFRAKDTGNLPVQIHIRPVVGGKPSHTTIVPDSHVYLQPSSVDAIGASPNLSTIQSRPTDFVFDEPIQLQPRQKYAIVVSSQSTEYELFSAKAGETVYGSTNKTVTSQSAPGALFLPQNGFNWIETKNQDIMFKLTRAKYDVGGGSLVLKNTDLPVKLLDENPIRTYNGTGKVYVSHMCHGLKPGDTAELDSCEAINGITANQLNNQFTVDSADLNGYTVTTAGTATGDGYGGGEKVLSQRNVNFSTMNPTVEVSVPQYTSIDASARMHTGSYISDTQTRFTRDDQYKRISLNQNVDFATARGIFNSGVETANLAGEPSASVKLDMKTTSDFVSPIVDMQRASLILAGFCFDDPSVTPHVNPVDDEAPEGGSTGFQHVAQPVTLQQTAHGIATNFEVNLPQSANVRVYARYAESLENLSDRPWEEMSRTSVTPNDNGPDFQQMSFLLGGQEGNLTGFNRAQVKVVGVGAGLPPAMRGLNTNFLSV